MAEVAQAWVSLVPEARGFGAATSRQLDPQMSKAGKQGGGRFAAGLKSAIGPAVALLGTAAIGGFLKDSIGEAREAQKVGALTANVIKTTGGAAKVSAKEVGNLATAISNKTGIDDEAVQSGSNLLLTFTGIKRAGTGLDDVFGRATAAAVDLSASGFGDINGASKQLGKALNDPIKGITALSKSGVTFTEQQKAQIKTLVKSGKTLDAQKIILAGVEEQVKGSAAAMSTNGEKASIAFGNLKEDIGTALLPVIDRLAKTLTTKIIPAISGFVAGMRSGSGAGGQFVSILKSAGSTISTVFSFIKNNATALGAFVGTIVVLVGAVRTWVAVQTLLNIALTANPIGLIIVGIAALVAGVIYAYTHFETFRNIVNSAFAGIKQAVAVAMPYVKAIIQGAVDQILGIVKVFKSLFTGDWKGVWEGVKQIVRGAWTVIKTLLKAQLDIVVGLVKNIGPGLLSAASAAFGAIKAGAQAGWAKAKEYVRGIPGKITDAFSGAKTLLSDIGGFMVDGLKNGLEASWHKVTDFVDKGIKLIPKKIRSLMGIKSPSKVTTELGRYIGQGLANGIQDGTVGVNAYLSGLKKTITGSLTLKKTRPGMSKKERAAVADYNDAARKAIKTQNAAVDALGKSLAGLAGKIDTAKGKLNELQDARTQLSSQTASSISGELDLTQTGGKKMSFATVAANVSGLASRAKAFAGKLRALLAAGIPAGLVQEVASLGTVAGIGVADALLSGSQQQIGQLAADYAGIDTYSKDIGNVIAGSMYDAGIQAQQGLLNGLLNDAAIQSSADQLAKKLTKAVKKSLGIKSPSRVFQNEVGKYLPAGIVAGIDDGQRALDRRVAGMVSVAKIGSVSPGDFGGGVAASAQAPITQNVYPQPGQSEEEIGRAAANRLAWALS